MLDLQKFLSFIGGKKLLPEWHLADSQGFIEMLNTKKAAASTVYRIFATLTHFAKYLEKKRVLDPDDNPLKGVQRPPKQGMVPRHIAIYGPGRVLYMEGQPAYDLLFEAAIEEITLMQECGPRRYPRRVWPYRDKSLLQFLYHTGLRVSEVCNIDFRQMRDLPHIKAKEFVDVRYKGNKTRTVFLDSVATEGLIDYLINERKMGAGPLFPSPQIKSDATLLKDDYTMDEYELSRLSRGSVTSILKRFGKRAAGKIGPGYEFEIHPHRLRHERGYTLKMAGGTPEDIQKELGHSTTQYAALYSQPGDNERREWLNSIGKQLQVDSKRG